MKLSSVTGLDYIFNLMSEGLYYFTTQDAINAFHTSAKTTKQVLWRLKKKGLINSPHRGFHVIVPPEYKTYSCLPADQFIPDLMKHLKIPYYAGLLSAAQFHGAAHQRPQIFQVVVPKNRSAIECGRVRVEFIARKNLQKIPVETRNTPRGIIQLSTPEGTALDLITYPGHAGGLSNVVTVLNELSEKIRPEFLLKVAKQTGSLPQIQRLGYLFEVLKFRSIAKPLALYVKKYARLMTPLSPGLTSKKMPKSVKWKVIINTQVEIDS